MNLIRKILNQSSTQDDREFYVAMQRLLKSLQLNSDEDSKWSVLVDENGDINAIKESRGVKNNIVIKKYHKKLLTLQKGYKCLNNDYFKGF